METVLLMQIGWRRTILRGCIRSSAILVVVVFAGSLISSAEKRLRVAEIRLKNGTTLRGEFLVMNSLAGRAVGSSEMKQIKDEDSVPHNIGRIDNGWQRIYFPFQQGKVADGPGAPIPVTFDHLPRPRRQGQNLTVTSFGSMTYVSPFDEFGRRRLEIATDRKLSVVFQAISEVSPDHVLVESTNCDWKLGLSLKAIPTETLDTLLKKQIKQDDPVDRFALVRFYSQAEYYPQAFKELDSIGSEFPDRKEQVEKSREDLMNFWGREILRHLGRRKRAGQHQLAENYAKKLLNQPLSGPVQLDVRQYVQAYEQSRQTIEQAKLLLSDWQAKLNDPVRVKLLQSLRSEVNEQLDFETLPRLDTFLKAEADKQYEPAQRLGLAYSGWILGSANAIPDLDQALRLWDARHAVIDYIRSDDPNLHGELIQKLGSIESISPQAVLNLVPQLPPALDASDIEPGSVHRVETAEDGKIGYSVVLPAEYSPRHNYPLIVALRARNRSIEQTLSLWAGDAERLDFGSQRGYIVIAPDYAEKTQAEHTYGAPAHKYVLECLQDARKRFAVDSDRVFLTGHGMGADAAFDIGMAHPDEFAGVLPIGGNALHYCNHSWMNGSLTAWYVVGKGYDSKENRDATSNSVFDKMLIHGIKFDFMLVEYLGRNGENLFDDFGKIFDWMDSHVRAPQPKKFDVRSLRKADNRFFWVTALNLPRDYILPAPAGSAQKINPMVIDARVTPGNTVILKAPTDSFTLRLTPDLVDFDKKLVINIGGREKSIFVKPDTSVLLDELRLRGDRKRLPLAVISP